MLDERGDEKVRLENKAVFVHGLNKHGSLFTSCSAFSSNPLTDTKALRYYVVMFLEVYDSRELETGGPLNAGKTAHGNH